jgi:hypothetical protein
MMMRSIASMNRASVFCGKIRMSVFTSGGDKNGREKQKERK